MAFRSTGNSKVHILALDKLDGVRPINIFAVEDVDNVIPKAWEMFRDAICRTEPDNDTGGLREDLAHKVHLMVSLGDTALLNTDAVHPEVSEARTSGFPVRLSCRKNSQRFGRT